MITRLVELSRKGIQNPQRIPSYARTVTSMTRRRLASLSYISKYQSDFQNVQRYCMFIGHGRTGHSLVGSLLNAHPEMVISHELNVLLFLEKTHIPLTRNQLFALIMHRDAEFNKKGREWDVYKYDISGASQGEFKTLRVLGDNQGGASSRILGRSPGLLQDLRETVDVPIRVVHIVRNPYDTIASNRKRSDDWDESAIDGYFSKAETVEEITGMLSTEEFYRAKYENLVENPRGILSELCEFLGVEATDEYLTVCSDFIFDQPKQTRTEVDWSEEQLAQIGNQKENHSWLKEYSYDA